VIVFPGDIGVQTIKSESLEKTGLPQIADIVVNPLLSFQRELTRIRKRTRPQRIFAVLILLSSDAFDDVKKSTSTVDFLTANF
jgi:hypothetical protein